ncbi:MAG: DUF616 domain-containing protein [Bacteroidales bacterium]|nr:DUF616 domain-containing protein [Bacteroidales bacterium]
MNRKVIYTCLTGGYDRLEQPVAVAPDWDYVCFTDAEGQDGVWQLRKIPFESPDPVVRSRYPKILPHKVLPEYKYSVYMDANLCIMDAEFYCIADRLIVEAVSFAQVEHPERDCVYEELRYCYLKDKVGTRTAFRLHRQWTAMGFPRHAGLYENNILYREHDLDEVQALDEAWWKAFSAGVPRDQLCLMPVFLRHGIHHPALLLGKGLNARNVPYLKYTLHPPTGKENTPGRVTWGNLVYHVRLGWRKLMLRFLK